VCGAPYLPTRSAYSSSQLSYDLASACILYKKRESAWATKDTALARRVLPIPTPVWYGRKKGKPPPPSSAAEAERAVLGHQTSADHNLGGHPLPSLCSDLFRTRFACVLLWFCLSARLKPSTQRLEHFSRGNRVASLIPIRWPPVALLLIALLWRLLTS
jgi:hypothetical protein